MITKVRSILFLNHLTMVRWTEYFTVFCFTRKQKLKEIYLVWVRSRYDEQQQNQSHCSSLKKC